MTGAAVTVLLMCVCLHAGIRCEAEEKRPGRRGKVSLVTEGSCFVPGGLAPGRATGPGLSA